MITFLISFRVFATVDLAKNSKSAILIESTTGKILYEKNSNEKRSPASMTKMMTLLLTTEALENGKIKLDDMVHVSKNASSMGGTQIFLEENSEISVETLLKGISIASANDAAVAVGEYIGGTLDNFVSMFCRLEYIMKDNMYKDGDVFRLEEMYQTLKDETGFDIFEAIKRYSNKYKMDDKNGTWKSYDLPDRKMAG